MEIYKVTLRIQSKYGKTRTRKNSVYGHFSRSDYLAWYFQLDISLEGPQIKLTKRELHKIEILVWHIYSVSMQTTKYYKVLLVKN